MKPVVETVVKARTICGESPCWDAPTGRLYWVDIKGCELHHYNPNRLKDASWSLPTTVGTVAPVDENVILLAMQDGIFSFNLVKGKRNLVLDIETTITDNRFNDGKCDSKGRFWAGTMALAEDRPVGSLYRLNTDLTYENCLSGITVSNGLDWSLDDKTMYFIDSPTRGIDAFDFDVITGGISNRRTIIRTPTEEGVPDGMTVDEEGMIWVAMWGGWCICRYNPITSEKLMKIEIPAKRVTSCAFGGQNMNELYITSAAIGDNGVDSRAEEPLAGSLFRVKLPFKGKPANRFKGKI